MSAPFTQKFGHPLSTAFVLVVFALFDAYVVASPGELRVNTLLGFERQYSYGDVAEVITASALIAPNGNTVHRRVYLVKFKDGTSYSTDNMPAHELADRSHSLLIQAILQRTGLSLKESSIFKRGEL